MTATITSKEMLKILEKSKVKNAVIIDIRCMNNRSEQIKNRLNDPNRLKIFYGGSKEIFNNLVNTFKLRRRKDLMYRQRLTTRVACKITIYYWYHYHKFLNCRR